jgi:hypothetical protein
MCGALYGIPSCDAETTQPSRGFTCTCEGGGSHLCSQQCDPGTFTSFNPGLGCRCNSDGGGFCEEYALDGGTDGG